jgi:hypothetical protein
MTFHGGEGGCSIEGSSLDEGTRYTVSESDFILLASIGTRRTATHK